MSGYSEATHINFKTCYALFMHYKLTHTFTSSSPHATLFFFAELWRFFGCKVSYEAHKSICL